MNDFNESWTDRQVLAAVRGLPIPSSDEPPTPSNEPEGTTSTSLFPVQEHQQQQQQQDPDMATTAITTTTSVGFDDTNPTTKSSLEDNNAGSHNTDANPFLDDQIQQRLENLSIAIPSARSDKDNGLNDTNSNSNGSFLGLPVLQLPSTSAPTSSSFMFDNSNNNASSSHTFQLSSSPTTPFPKADTSLNNSTGVTTNDSFRTLDPSASGAYSSTTDSTTQPSNTYMSETDDNNAKGPDPSSLSSTATPATITNNNTNAATRSRANTTSCYGPAPSHKPANQVPSEVLLYRGAIECPICFLIYPKYLNLTRCCAQPICTECFVQIKRPDPHPPHDEHEGEGSNTPNSISTPSAASVSASTPGPSDSSSPSAAAVAVAKAIEPLLVSEPACCPYCMLPDFGVTFTPCPFRSGLEPPGGFKKMSPLSPILAARVSVSGSGSTVGANDSNSSLVSPGSPAESAAASGPTAAGSSTSGINRRRGSVPANAPDVVTIDRIRPDWSLKLAAARAHAARKSAQATALHASAFLMNSQRRGGGASGSGSRRNRRASNENGSRQGTQSRQRSRSLLDDLSGNPGSGGSGSSHGGEYVRETRQERQAREERNRTEHLEDIMMMEAIRLSLLDEENRKAKEEEEKRNKKNDS